MNAARARSAAGGGLQRVAILAAVIGVHGAIIAVLAVRGMTTKLPGAISISLEQEGPPAEASAAASPMQVEETEPDPPSPEASGSDVSHTAPKVETPPPDPEPILEEQPAAPLVEDRAELAEPRKADEPLPKLEPEPITEQTMVPKELPPEAKPAPKEVARKPQTKSESAAKARPGANSTGSGAAASSSAGDSGAIAAYAARVRSVLQAKAQSIVAKNPTAVGITFSIAASGSVASVAIRSSGDPALDKAVRAIVAGSSFPPPPGGKFAGSVTIRLR